METKVLLVRHAESAMNVQPHIIGGQSNEAELSAVGKRQALDLGKQFDERGIKPDFVYSSPAVRTLGTAAISLAEAGIHTPVQIENDLLELSQGDNEKRVRTEVYTPEYLASVHRLGLDHTPPGGESMNMVADRMIRMLELMRQQTGTHLVYTHGLAIRSMVGRLFYSWTHQEVYQAVAPNVSMTTLTHDGEWRIENFAEQIIQTEN